MLREWLWNTLPWWFWGVMLLAAFVFLSSVFENWSLGSGGEVTYDLFYIKEMPCVYVEVGSGYAKTGGPSCDWSKWEEGD